MKLKKIIGYCLVAIPFVFFIVSTGVFVGWGDALVVFVSIAIATVFSALMVLGVLLTINND